jgi:hypothetical protein
MHFGVFKRLLPDQDDLLTGELGNAVQQQFGEFLPELGRGQHVAQLLVVSDGGRLAGLRLTARLDSGQPRGSQWTLGRLAYLRRDRAMQCVPRRRDWPGGRAALIGLVAYDVHIERLPPSVASHDLESDLFSRNQHVRIAIENGRVQKYVFPAIIRRDKPIPACWIELQYSPCSQFLPSSYSAQSSVFMAG